MNRDDVYTLALCTAKAAEHPAPEEHATKVVEEFDKLEAEAAAEAKASKKVAK